MSRRGQRLLSVFIANSAAHFRGDPTSASHRYVRRRHFMFGARVMNRYFVLLLCGLVSSATFSSVGVSRACAEDFGMSSPVAFPAFSTSNLGVTKLTTKFPALSAMPTTMKVPTTSLLTSTSFDSARSSSFHSALNAPGNGSWIPSTSMNTNNSLLRPTAVTSPVTTNLLGHSDSMTSHLHSNSLLRSGMTPSQSQMLVTPTTSFERRY